MVMRDVNSLEVLKPGQPGYDIADAVSVAVELPKIKDWQNHSIMTKTTAEVKRWRHVGSRMLETIEPADGEFVLATDYATLQQRCRDLTECVQAMTTERGMRCACGKVEYMLGKIERCKWCLLSDKVKALIGGEKGVGAC